MSVVPAVIPSTDDKAHLARLRAWLNEGTALANELGGPALTAEKAALCRVPISALSVALLADFLDGLAVALDPDVWSAARVERPSPAPVLTEPANPRDAVFDAELHRLNREETDRLAREAMLRAMMESGRDRLARARALNAEPSEP